MLLGGIFLPPACSGGPAGFGTGSAAPWDGRDSVKSVAELFTATGALNPQHSTGLGGIMSAEEQQALVDAATQVWGETIQYAVCSANSLCST